MFFLLSWSQYAIAYTSSIVYFNQYYVGITFHFIILTHRNSSYPSIMRTVIVSQVMLTYQEQIKGYECKSYGLGKNRLHRTKKGSHFRIATPRPPSCRTHSLFGIPHDLTSEMQLSSWKLHIAVFIPRPIKLHDLFHFIVAVLQLYIMYYSPTRRAILLLVGTNTG